MTGMCGGRGEDDEDEGKDTVEVGGATGPGEVLAGAGSSGGGEERFGDPLTEVEGALGVTAPPRLSSSSSSSLVPVLMVSAW